MDPGPTSRRALRRDPFEAGLNEAASGLGAGSLWAFNTSRWAADTSARSRAVDGGDLQGRNFADPQARRIGGRQRDAVGTPATASRSRAISSGVSTGGSFSATAAVWP
jgi:hypothetical protein